MQPGEVSVINLAQQVCPRFLSAWRGPHGAPRRRRDLASARPSASSDTEDRPQAGRCRAGIARADPAPRHGLADLCGRQRPLLWLRRSEAQQLRVPSPAAYDSRRRCCICTSRPADRLRPPSCCRRRPSAPAASKFCSRRPRRRAQDLLPDRFRFVEGDGR